MAAEEACEATAEERELLPLPAECADDEATEEQTTEEIPSCPMPSSHYQQCPHGGCPYMGGSCPYYRGTPVVTPVEKPKKVRSKKKIKDVPQKDLSVEKFWQKLLGVSADGPQGQAGIDTMEFRPSDDPRDPPGSSPF
jgi:hypothetical protein